MYVCVKTCSSSFFYSHFSGCLKIINKFFFSLAPQWIQWTNMHNGWNGSILVDVCRRLLFKIFFSCCDLSAACGLALDAVMDNFAIPDESVGDAVEPWGDSVALFKFRLMLLTLAVLCCQLSSNVNARRTLSGSLCTWSANVRIPVTKELKDNAKQICVNFWVHQFLYIF